MVHARINYLYILVIEADQKPTTKQEKAYSHKALRSFVVVFFFFSCNKINPVINKQWPVQNIIYRLHHGLRK